MSTATDLNNTEQRDLDGQHTHGGPYETVKLDQINNWTGRAELPFDPIAERTLDMEAHGPNGPEHGALHVIFAKPLLIEDQGWACLYKLSAMGRTHISPARGLDPVDALQQAFTMVHRQLQGMGRMHRITFNGQDDLGFAPAGVSEAAKAAGCPVMGGAMSL